MSGLQIQAQHLHKALLMLPPKEATKEHPAHFSVVLDESKAEEPPTSWHEVADTETRSEEDINCSNAETSGYAITRIW